MKRALSHQSAFCVTWIAPFSNPLRVVAAQAMGEADADTDRSGDWMLFGGLPTS